MRVEARAKVNLRLRVLRRREDGFHEIESLMVPISLADTLEIERVAEGGLAFTCDDATLPTDDSNLVVRTARLFCAKTSAAPHLRVHLQKRIPHGAGLGGGSSDAAATMRALNELHDSPLTLAEMSELCAELGSDVPFFLQPGAATVSGRGEVVTPCDFPHTLPLLLLKPPFGVPTPWAYQRWRDSREMAGVRYEAQELAWGELVNDLERPVFEKYLLLADLKMWLLAQREVAGALMSGSGATMMAVLREEAAGAELLERARGEFGETLWSACCQAGAPGNQASR